MSTTQALNYFLDIEEAKGESQQQGAKSQISVRRWNYGGHATSTVSQSGGLGAGKPVMHPVEIEAELDSSFAKLAGLLTKGKHLAKAELTALKQSGDGAKVFFTVTMEKVFVTNLHVEGQGDEPIAAFTLTYQTIKTEYKKQDSTSGTLTVAGTHEYDLSEGKTTS